MSGGQIYAAVASMRRCFVCRNYTTAAIDQQLFWLGRLCIKVHRFLCNELYASHEASAVSRITRPYQHSFESCPFIAPEQTCEAGVHETILRGGIHRFHLGTADQIRRVGETVHGPRTRGETKFVMLLNQVPCRRSDRVPRKRPCEGINRPARPRADLLSAFHNFMLQSCLRQLRKIDV